MSERYAKNAGAVVSLNYHVVWCPKYRRSVLVKPVDVRLKALPFGTRVARQGNCWPSSQTMSFETIAPDYIYGAEMGR